VPQSSKTIVRRLASLFGQCPLLQEPVRQMICLWEGCKPTKFQAATVQHQNRSRCQEVGAPDLQTFFVQPKASWRAIILTSTLNLTLLHYVEASTQRPVPQDTKPGKQGPTPLQTSPPPLLRHPYPLRLRWPNDLPKQTRPSSRHRSAARTVTRRPLPAGRCGQWLL